MGLVVAALRWRLAASLLVLTLATLATAAAALGPLYARSAEESLLRDHLAVADPVATGLRIESQLAGQPDVTADQLLEAVTVAAAADRLERYFEPATTSVQVAGSTVRTPAGRALGTATVAWRERMCEGITVTSGTCPDRPGEAMLSSREAEGRGLGVGSRIRLGLSADVAADTAAVVGLYDVGSADPSVWGVDTPAQSAAAPLPGDLDRLDQVLVDGSVLLASTGPVEVAAFRPLRTTEIHLTDLAPLSLLLSEVTEPVVGTDGPVTVTTSNVVAEVEVLRAERDGLRQSAFAITAQLVLVAWFVLFLVVAATSEERGNEVALAKLRGFGRARLAWFGLAQNVVLLVLAVPLGLLLAAAVDRFLVTQALAEGTTVTVDGAVVAAVGLAFLGGVIGTALAARRMLAAPVLEQLRRTTDARLARAGWATTDVVALTLAVVAVLQLRGGQTSGLALLAPGLVALSVGLLGARALPAVAGRWVSRTRRTPHVASFLAARNLGRRPGAGRLLVLVTLTAALTVFSVDLWTTTTRATADIARAEVGAGTVWTVTADSPTALVDAVAAADPDGRTAMAAVQSDDAVRGGLVAVDTPRLAAVSAWDPRWAGTTAVDLVAVLRPDSAEPVAVERQLAVTAGFDRARGRQQVRLVAVVEQRDGTRFDIDLGLLEDGSHRYEGELTACLSPCRLVGLSLQSEGLRYPPTRGTLRLTGVEDARGPVPGATAPGRWRAGLPPNAAIDPTFGQPVSVTDDAGAVVVDFDGGVGDAVGIVEVADHPYALPVLVARDTPLDVSPEDGLARAPDLWQGTVVVRPEPAAGVLPRLGSTGFLADLRYADLAAADGTTAPELQVWVAEGSSAQTLRSLREALADQGVTVVSESTLAQRRDELARGATSLVLRLLLVAAAAAVLLAGIAIMTAAVVAARRRAYELTALWALGASRGVLVSAARREQLLLAAAGVVAGAVIGLATARTLVGSLTALAGGSDVPGTYTPDWGPLAAVVVGLLLLVAVVAQWGAWRAARAVDADVLREGAA